MSEHTPGPWSLYYDGTIYGNKDEEVVCSFDWSSFKEFNDSPRLKATARLIAAAPELLERVKEMHKELCDACCPKLWTGHGPRPHESLCSETAELIDKAEGKAMV